MTDACHGRELLGPGRLAADQNAPRRSAAHQSVVSAAELLISADTADGPANRRHRPSPSLSLCATKCTSTDRVRPSLPAGTAGLLPPRAGRVLTDVTRDLKELSMVDVRRQGLLGSAPRDGTSRGPTDAIVVDLPARRGLHEAERPDRCRLHGRDQALPASDRLPRHAATPRAGVAGGRRRLSAGPLRPRLLRASRVASRRPTEELR
jgi:hypothetical protein